MGWSTDELGQNVRPMGPVQSNGIQKDMSIFIDLQKTDSWKSIPSLSISHQHGSKPGVTMFQCSNCGCSRLRELLVVLILSSLFRFHVYYGQKIVLFLVDLHPNSCRKKKTSLVGGSATPLKNMKVNWDDDIPNIWENKKWQPNHQPGKWNRGRWLEIPKSDIRSELYLGDEWIGWFFRIQFLHGISLKCEKGTWQKNRNRGGPIVSSCWFIAI